MARQVSVKCAIFGCHYQRKMTLAEREELRQMGRENNATAGLVCPAHMKAAFNFEFDDIDIDVPLEELLVEASKEFPRWRVMLAPLPGAESELNVQAAPSRGDRVVWYYSRSWSPEAWSSLDYHSVQLRATIFKTNMGQIKGRNY